MIVWFCSQTTKLENCFDKSESLDVFAAVSILHLVGKDLFFYPLNLLLHLFLALMFRSITFFILQVKS